MEITKVMAIDMACGHAAIELSKVIPVGEDVLREELRKTAVKVATEEEAQRDS